VSAVDFQLAATGATPHVAFRSLVSLADRAVVASLEAKMHCGLQDLGQAPSLVEAEKFAEAVLDGTYDNLRPATYGPTYYVRVKGTRQVVFFGYMPVL
jgi:hypothetical protein